MAYDKTAVVCLTVALPYEIHDALKAFCESVSEHESRPVTQAEIARLALIRFLKAKGVTVPV